jgi:uncharacterized protein YecT (DUF1311 family)
MRRPSPACTSAPWTGTAGRTRITSARFARDPRAWSRIRAKSSAEQLWERFREAECDFRSSQAAGRREYQVVRLRCLAELTEVRTAVLAAQS